MQIRMLAVTLTILVSQSSYAGENVAELRAQLQKLAQQVEMLQKRLAGLSADNSDLVDPNESPSPVANKVAPVPAQHQKIPLVDLEVSEQAAVDQPNSGHVLANPWWQNFEIYGFAAAGAYDTGSAGTRNHGGFEIKEASLFFEANIWEHASFFLEWRTNRLGRDSSSTTSTGEVYLHFRDIAIGDALSFGVKLGRLDIPFGEEYLRQDAIDNPLITTSAAYPYGLDEGLIVYSAYRGINWIVGVADGTDARSIEDDSEKAWNVKIYGNPTESLYLSLSFMSNGNAGRSAFEFGGSHFRPVGDGRFSTLGTSPSDSVDAMLGEVDARYSFKISATIEGYIAAAFGSAQQNDAQSSFDRDFHWFSIEPYISYKNEWYGILRYSEIGTYDNNEGFQFDGKTFAGGNAAFGFDTQRFRRFGLGLGWTPNPNVRAKFEIGKDWFNLIDASLLPTNNDERSFLGLEVATKF